MLSSNQTWLLKKTSWITLIKGELVTNGVRSKKVRHQDKVWISIFVKGNKYDYVCNLVYCSVILVFLWLLDTSFVSNSNRLKNNLHLCLYNCRSLTNKLIDFQNFVYSSTYNLIGLTETWLDGNTLDYN